MKKWIQGLCLTTIVLSSTQVITLPFGGISLFQLSLIITMMASIAVFFFRKKICISKNNVILMIAWIISSFTAYLLSDYPSIARSYLLVGIMTSYFIICIPAFFSIDDIDKLERALIRSQYITIIMSIYTYYMFYFGGGLRSSIVLPLGMHIDLDRDFAIRAQASGQVRLALPYATPPVLSGVMSICIVILLTNKNLFPKLIRFLLLGIYSIILLYTGSRTGYVSLIIFVGFYGFRYLKAKQNRNKKLILMVFVICLVFAAIYLWNRSSYFKLFIGRMDLKTMLQDRHVQLFVDGILIWTESIKNIFIGIGFGNGMNYTHMKSGGAPYFFNFFVTTVAERGLLGLVIVIILVAYLVKAFKYIVKIDDHRIISVGAIYITALISALFYEMLSCYFVVIVVSIFCMAAQSNLMVAKNTKTTLAYQYDDLVDTNTKGI